MLLWFDSLSNNSIYLLYGEGIYMATEFPLATIFRNSPKITNSTTIRSVKTVKGHYPNPMKAIMAPVQGPESLCSNVIYGFGRQSELDKE